MAKQLKNTDFVEKGLFDSLISDAADAEKALEGVEKKFSEVGKTAKESADNFDLGKTSDIQKLDELIKDLVESVKELSKVQKQRRDIDKALTKEQKAIIKLQKDNTESVEENRVELQKLRIEKREQNKIDRRTAVQQSKLTTEYQKQSARLQELRDIQKDLILTGQTAGDTFARNQKELEELDAALKETDARVGQFQRSVGNYEKAGLAAAKATEKLQKSLDGIKGGAAALGGILAGGGLVGKALNSTQDGADGVRIALEAVDKAINTLFASVAIGVSGALKDLTAQSSILDTVLSALFGGIQGFADGVAPFLKTLEQQAKITEETIKFERSLNDQLEKGGTIRQGLTNTLLDQVNAFEKTLALSDQDTRNLIERSKLLTLAEEQAEAAFETETKIAEGRLALANKELQLAGENNLLIVQAEAKITEARGQLAQIEANRTQQRIELAERQGKVLSDQFELDLDLLIDFTDRVRTANEKLIDNENITIEARRAILKDTTLLVEEAIDDQVNKFNELENAQRLIEKQRQKREAGLKEGEDIRDTQLEQQEQLNLSLNDFNRLLGLNAENLGEEAKRLGLSEIGQNRLREAVIEAVAARAELLEVNNNLLKSEENLTSGGTGIIDTSQFGAARETPERVRKRLTDELNKEIREGTIKSTRAIANRRIEIEKEVSAINKRLNDERSKSIEATENDLIKSLEKRRQLQKDLEAETDDSERERIKEQIRRTDLAINGQISRIEEFSKRRKEIDDDETENAIDNINKREEAQKRAREAAQAALVQIQQQNAQRRREGIDEEIEDAKRRQQTLEILARQGSETQEDNLANQKKLQAEAELERKRQIRRERIEEFALAGIKAYSANAGEPNAVGKTLTDLALVSAGIRALLPAYDGYDGGQDDTGGTGFNRDAFGGIKGFFHDREQVWSKKDRDAVGWRNREEIKDIVRAHDAKANGFDAPKVVAVSRFDSNAEVLRKFDRLENAIKSQPKQQSYYDAYKKAIVEEIKQGNRVERNHRKVGGLFGGSKR